MIRRRSQNEDDPLVHIWLGETPENADKPVCGRQPGPPSPDESGPPCMRCHLQHGDDLAAIQGDTAWRQ